MGLKAVGLGAILFVTGMCIYGMVHAVHIYTTRYEVPSKKDAHLKIALVADLHLGYSIGSHQMEEMVEKINAEEPDVVVIAGDIFDNEYDAIYEPDRVADLLAGLKSRYGTYACYGNHDLDEKILAGFTFETKEERVVELRQIIIDGFEQKKPHVSQRWDASARKWRTVSEPAQWPDQYVHHALIQVLQPVFMRGMDYYCCGSIRDRGPHHARKAIEI